MIVKTFSYRYMFVSLKNKGEINKSSIRVKSYGCRDTHAYLSINQ